VLHKSGWSLFGTRGKLGLVKHKPKADVLVQANT